MKEGLLDNIKSRGYWRINFQPMTKKERINSIDACRQIVEKNSVILRGWDFPHIPRRDDESGRILPCSDYVEAWTDWAHYKEFWRMYKDGQFLSYRGLREDWFEFHPYQPHLATEIKQMKNLGVMTSVIYEITEYFIFCSRLAQEGLFEEGVVMNLKLLNIFERKLWLEDSSRIPFHFDRITGAKELPFSKTYGKDDIISNYQTHALDIILKVFDSFGWSPAADSIKNEQNNLLSRKIL